MKDAAIDSRFSQSPFTVYSRMFILLDKLKTFNDMHYE